MSDTQRTDKLYELTLDSFKALTADQGYAFACQLERENEALRKDAERLNWIDEQGLCGFGHVGYGDYRVYCGKPFGNVRLVIDAARLPAIKEQS